MVTQIVSYPLFLNVDEKIFTSYHSEYVKRITIIVMPIMIIELALTIMLYYMLDGFLSQIFLISIVLIFISTVIIQVPIHNKLKFSYDEHLAKKLIKTNWIRTFLWTIKALICYNIIVKELF
tara:strand:- start:102 stop:467 length:366 start_codon:yes stop_codon:yes gene_type:complete